MAESELIFEIAFVAREGKAAPSLEELRRFFREMEGVSSSRNNPHLFCYRNPDTQVGCDFVAYQPQGSDIGLAYELPLPRPLFYALETLPLVVQVAREFQLDVELLSPDNTMPCCEPTFERLLTQWQLANRDEVEALAAEGVNLPRLDNQALEAMWEFMLLRTELARRYNRSHVQVPPVELVRPKGGGPVSRVVRWRNLTPAALADSDYVWLENPPDPLRDGTLVRSQDLRDFAKFAYRDLAQPVYHRLFDKARVQQDLIQALAQMPVRQALEFEAVPFSAVVDRELTPLLDQ